MSPDIQRRLERLERLEAARTVTVKYAEAVDNVDLDALAAVFTEDATLTIPSGSMVGRDAILDFYRSRFTGSTKRHFLANVVVTDDADGLSVSSYYLFTSREPDASGIGWGRYRDEITLAASGAALLSAKTITPDVASTLDKGWHL